MARHRTPTDERQTLLDLAGTLLPGRGELVVILARGEVVTLRPQPSAAGPVPEGLSAYDAAIVRALADRPLSSARLAHRAGHRHNSYFRQRLRVLVEAGLIRHTARGYSRPGV